MKQKRIKIDHPLWNRLRELDKVAAKRFPAQFDEGLAELGLILYAQPQNGGYYCTPTNTLAFAGTGGDGVHFSFLVEEGKVTEKSPIVITIPVGDPNFIGGESLFDFLCLGYHRGYFGLGNCASDKFFDAYGSGEWEPTEDWEYAVGYGVDEHKRKLLDFLIAELGLSPWSDLKQKFWRLQEVYMPLLQMPQEKDFG